MNGKHYGMHIKKVSYLCSTFPQIFVVSKALYNNITSWLRPFTVSFLLWGGATHSQINSLGSIQDKGCHILASQSMQWTYLEYTCSTNCHHLPGTYFTNPQRDGRLSQPAGSGTRTRHLLHKSQTCYWLSYLAGISFWASSQLNLNTRLSNTPSATTNF